MNPVLNVASLCALRPYSYSGFSRWRRGYIGIASLDTKTASAQLIPDKVNLSVVGSWLHQCRYDHPACNANRHAPLTSSKAIDCRTRLIISLPLESCYEYVTLSYVWGTNTDVSWDSKNSFPKLIEDTIKVVRGLGLKYLWVDRYCIPRAHVSFSATRGGRKAARVSDGDEIK